VWPGRTNEQSPDGASRLHRTLRLGASLALSGAKKSDGRERQDNQGDGDDAKPCGVRFEPSAELDGERVLRGLRRWGRGHAQSVFYVQIAGNQNLYYLYGMSRSRSQAPHRLREARLARGFSTAAEAADAFGWNRNTYASNENGNAPFSFRRAQQYAAAFGLSAVWLYDGLGAPDADASPPRDAPVEQLVPVIGRVGADPEGIVMFAAGQPPGDLVPIPPGGTAQAVALQVIGHSMTGLADHGGLIYFEDQRTPPSEDMLGHVVVVEIDTEEVLVKRLLRGSRRGLYDLESVVGPVRRDCKVRWAAHITAIIPPFQARRIIRAAAA